MSRYATLPATALATLLTTGALAGTGAEGVFTIYNDTDGNVVSGFYTSEDNGDSWSANWLSVQILSRRIRRSPVPCQLRPLRTGPAGRMGR